MTGQLRERARRIGVLIGLAALAAGCGDRQAPDSAQVEIRGSAPAGATGTAGAPLPGSGAAQPGPAGAPRTLAGGDVLQYDGYQAARAREGDTVSTLAGRIGLSASELGAYNGLAPTHPLRAGDELVLPPRPGGYAVAAPAVPQGTGIAAAPIEALPLGADTSAPADPLAAVPGAAPQTSPLPSESGWSPDLALAAIDRAETPAAPAATPTPGTTVALPEPPSAGSPLPPEPTRARPLESPRLDQYQTPTGQPAAPAPAEELVFAPDEGTATAEPPAGAGRLLRPVDGPVALGYREGAGSTRNDGVDFAAPAGAPVRAAGDGEVALVSEALGGLGTIVLVRHPGELLTVYGRITGVTVKKGEIVSRGQQIGTVAPAQSPAEPRMHFEVREGANSVDPMLYIGS